jgi:hypothetical protein
MVSIAPTGRRAQTMTKNLFELTIDVVELPTAADLHKYGIVTMRVRMNLAGPGEGYPVITLGFATGEAFKGRDNCRRFLTEWLYNGNDGVDEEVESHLSTAG